jgi:hypothetical protein
LVEDRKVGSEKVGYHSSEREHGIWDLVKIMVALEVDDSVVEAGPISDYLNWGLVGSSEKIS